MHDKKNSAIYFTKQSQMCLCQHADEKESCVVTAAFQLRFLGTKEFIA